MSKIRNINEAFGDAIEFASVEEMAVSVQACGYEIPADGLVESRDYEVIS